ncbi:MAG: hypothetical protein IKM99_03330 [Bacteroidales bacterium]|nr:hypothetical protein [Bacteroidales bacterium]
MKKLFVFFTLALCFPLVLVGQNKHNLFYGQFEVRGNSVLLPAFAGLFNVIPYSIAGAKEGAREGEEAYKQGKDINAEDFLNEEFAKEVLAESSKYDRWMHVSPMYDIHLPKWSMSNADGSIAMQGPDWWRCLLFGDFKHNYNCSVGYSLGWRSYVIPFGAKFTLGYEWRGLCVTEGELMGLHRTSGIVPSATVNWLLLGNHFERRKGWNIVLEGGVSYVKNLTYNDPIQMGNTAVNDGLRGIAALGYKRGTSLVSIRYEFDSYDYFNIPDVHTRLNSLMLSFSSMF